MKILSFILVLSASLCGCQNDSGEEFPVDYVYSIIDTGDINTTYLRGVMLDGAGERKKITMDQARQMRLECVTPEYYSQMMYWAGYEVPKP